MKYPEILIKLMITSEPYFKTINSEIKLLQNIAILSKKQSDISYAISPYKTYPLGTIIVHGESIMSPIEDMEGIIKRL